MWFLQKHASIMVPPTTVIDNHHLKEMDKQKYLGIIFDNHLQWGPQLSRVCSSISYYLHNLHCIGSLYHMIF